VWFSYAENFSLDADDLDLMAQHSQPTWRQATSALKTPKDFDLFLKNPRRCSAASLD
jgi:hypothetical protein